MGMVSMGMGMKSMGAGMDDSCWRRGMGMDDCSRWRGLGSIVGACKYLASARRRLCAPLPAAAGDGFIHTLLAGACVTCQIGFLVRAYSGLYRSPDERTPLCLPV